MAIFGPMSLRLTHFPVLFLPFLIAVSSLSAQSKQPPAAKPAPAEKAWVDSVYNKLTEEERIGQLFMVAAYSGGKNFNQDAIEKLIKAHQIGGLIFMQGGPARQAILTNRYQAMAQVPLLLSMDAEWGLGMRLDSVINFPKQMMLGASDDTAMAYALGMAVAYQCKRLGVHVNFAPVVDVNNNPANPVINARSFGEDKERVTRMAIAYMKGMQDFNIMACAKHFPGHGDTDVDSHQDLPVVKKSLAQLDTLELYPFKKLIAAGVQSMMIAHLSIPALEKEAHVPTTLSRNTVTNLLKQKMGFRGLIFTDALNMQGVAKYFAPGETDVRAFIAGNDVLLFSQDVPTAISKIKAAIQSGKASHKDLEHSVKKILHAKYVAGLAHFKPVELKNVTEDINQYTAALNSRIATAAVTLVSDGAKSPLTAKAKVLYIAVNGSLSEAAETQLRNAVGSLAVVPFTKTGNTAATLAKMGEGYDAVIIGVHGLSIYPANNYGMSEEQVKFLDAATQKKKVSVALMGNAYALKYVYKAPAVLIGYEDNQWTQDAVIKVMTGQRIPTGILPVTPVIPASANNTSLQQRIKQ